MDKFKRWWYHQDNEKKSGSIWVKGLLCYQFYQLQKIWTMYFECKDRQPAKSLYSPFTVKKTHCHKIWTNVIEVKWKLLLFVCRLSWKWVFLTENWLHSFYFLLVLRSETLQSDKMFLIFITERQGFPRWAYCVFYVISRHSGILG